jgi:integration host factor subunit beta
MSSRAAQPAPLGLLLVWGMFMTKSELIEILGRKRSDIPYKDIELAVKAMLEQMSESLAYGERIEIRGFGSFSLHFRPPRVGRNPKTGDAVTLSGKYVPHFKPGKDLRERVNNRDDHGSDDFF